MTIPTPYFNNNDLQLPYCLHPDTTYRIILHTSIYIEHEGYDEGSREVVDRCWTSSVHDLTKKQTLRKINSVAKKLNDDVFRMK